MEKLWKGRLQEAAEPIAEELNRSIGVDGRMYRQDALGSIAHAAMLKTCGIISAEDYEAIEKGLTEIVADIDSGKLTIDPLAEDIHTFLEGELTARVGEAGKRLHTARSRNDQVATDLKLYLREQIAEIKELLKSLLQVIREKANANLNTVMAGYTHLQIAQPVTYAQYLMAYASMFMRDVTRLEDCTKRMNTSPLGSCALAGTTYPVDRRLTAAALNFTEPCSNSMDGVSDRDYVMELSSDCAVIMTHLSRLSEEMIIWSGTEFGYLTLPDRFTTGSSIMPQKKNPDFAELIRGKTGRVFGDMISIFTVMKALPLAYNKDMQEDKEGVFDSIDTVKKCLQVMAPMLMSVKVNAEVMAAGAEKGYINATDCADYLTRKGMPFRTAYKLTGELVALCVSRKIPLSALPIADFRAASPLFEEDIYEAISLSVCLGKRTSEGGPAPQAVKAQIDLLDKFLSR